MERPYTTRALDAVEPVEIYINNLEIYQNESTRTLSRTLHVDIKNIGLKNNLIPMDNRWHSVICYVIRHKRESHDLWYNIKVDDESVDWNYLDHYPSEQDFIVFFYKKIGLLDDYSDTGRS